MVGVFLLFLIAFPLSLFYFTTIKLDLKHDLTNYYIIEAIIVFILVAIANIYYYKRYALNFLPAIEQIITDIIVGFFILLSMYIFSFLRSLFTSKERFELTDMLLGFVLFLVMTVLLLPVSQKYEYSKRVDKIHDILNSNGGSYMQKVDGLEIMLVDSSKQNHIRSRYNPNRNYRNYFYVKNTRETIYRGKVTLNIYGQDYNYIDGKTMDRIELLAGDIQLLAINQDIYFDYDVWNKKSFVTQEKIYYFDALLTSD